MVINNIFTVNGNFAYADVAGQATHTFNNLTSVENLTIDNVDGALSFASLTTAEVIDIDESEGDHDSDATTANAGMMTSLSMPLLASATFLAAANANSFDVPTIKLLKNMLKRIITIDPRRMSTAKMICVTV